MKKTEYAFGRSKVFIRNPRALSDLEEKRRIRNIQILIKIQSVFRGWLKRRQFKKMKKAEITIASHYRGFRAKREYVKQRNAAILIQSIVRMWKHRKATVLKRRAIAEASAKAQREVQEAEMQRRRAAAEEEAKRKRQAELTKASVVIAAHVRGWIVRKRTRALFRFDISILFISKILNLLRKNAGPVVARNIITFQKRMYLLKLAASLPTLSPTDNTWPKEAPVPYRPLNQNLKILYHDYRCKLYRQTYDKSQQLAMREKIVASQVNSKTLNFVCAY